jgi:hypothetical protein
MQMPTTGYWLMQAAHICCTSYAMQATCLQGYWLMQATWSHEANAVQAMQCNARHAVPWGKSQVCSNACYRLLAYASSSQMLCKQCKLLVCKAILASKTQMAVTASYPC